MSFPETPRSSGEPYSPEAFLTAFDYPGSHEDQEIFDGIVQTALGNLNPDLQRIFAVGADVVRWGLWPTSQPPLGIALKKWDHYINYDHDPALNDDTLSWCHRVFEACGFESLEVAVMTKRDEQKAPIKEVLRTYIQHGALVRHLTTFNTHQGVEERPLTYMEKISATAELRHTLARHYGAVGTTLSDPTSPAYYAWQRGLYQIEEATRSVATNAQKSAYQRLYNFVVRSHDAGRYSLSDTFCDMESLLEDSRELEITGNFEIVGFGSQALIADRNELVAADEAWSNGFILQAMCRASLAGKPYEVGLAEGIDWACDVAYGDVARLGRFEVPPYGLLMRLAGILQTETIPAESLPNVYLPIDDGEDVFGSKDDSRSSQKIVPSKTRPRANPDAARYQPPALDFSPITPEERAPFAYRRTPTVAPVTRLLELAEPYVPLKHGDVHMTIDMIESLPPTTMPYVEGYDLLATSVPQEGRYHFTKAEGDAYKLMPVPVGQRQQYMLAKAIERMGLEAAAEALGSESTLSLHGIAAVLRSASSYLQDGSRYAHLAGLSRGSFEELAQLVEHDVYHCRCDAAGLLLNQAVTTALPGVRTRFIRGKSIPSIGTTIAAADHVQLEVFIKGQLFRLDSTPSAGAASPVFGFDEYVSEVDSPYGSAAPTLPKPRYNKKKYHTTPAERVQNAVTYATELARVVTDQQGDKALERLLRFPEDDPLVAVLRLLRSGDGIPSQAEVEHVVSFCDAISSADAKTLTSVNLQRYLAYQDQLVHLTNRLIAIYE